MTDGSHIPSGNDVYTRTWVDAFPWLEGAVERVDQYWITEQISTSTPDARRSRIATIVELATLRLARWTIGQTFPNLPSNIDLLRLNLPTRARNVLQRNDCHTSHQLMAESLDDIVAWRNVGAGTISSILEVLADASTSGVTPEVLSPITLSTIENRPSAAVTQPAWILSIQNDLSRIALWLCAIGAPDQPLVVDHEETILSSMPQDLASALDRIRALQPTDVLHSEFQLDVAALLSKALGVLDDRAVSMLERRLFADHPNTLDQLGQLHGVTRERARQIEAKARGKLLGYLANDELLSSIMSTVRTMIGTIRPLQDLLEAMPALAGAVSGINQPSWRILDRLDDAYEIEDGWCVAPSMSSAQMLTDSLLQEKADRYGTIPLKSVELITPSYPEKALPLHRAWLAYCGYTIQNDSVLMRTSSVGDYAAAVLSLHGSPLAVQDIVDRFEVKRTAGSTRNALAIDERFKRVDRDRWALSEWDFEEYGGIRSVIREMVARGGGRAALNDVVEFITSRYSVSSNSVVAYAAASPFMTRDGIVQPARDRAPRKSPFETKRLFRRGEEWLFRTTISADHLRGSGFVAPVAVATIVGLQPGETRELSCRIAPQKIAWTGIQPQFGTIRRFLLDEDISVDTDVFLVIRDNQEFDLQLVRPDCGNPILDALSRIGAPVTTEASVAQDYLARAIGLTGDSSITGIIGSYRARGDDDIAELLISAYDTFADTTSKAENHPLTDVDEIMDLL